MESSLLLEAIKQHTAQRNASSCPFVEPEAAFFVASAEKLREKVRLWRRELPSVTPCYAVKCNGHPEVLKTLIEMDSASFDCASRMEIEQVIEASKAFNKQPQIIYAHPVKHESSLRFARANGVKRMTFDNVDELHKIKRVFPEAELILRISTDDKDAVCPLSCKFGAALDTTDELIQAAKSLDLDIAGVAFHVGSGSSRPGVFAAAISDAFELFKKLKASGFEPKVLDIGGGFEPESFLQAAAEVRESLAKYKEEGSLDDSIEIIAEPGRFIVAEAFSLAANVIGRRVLSETEDSLEARLYLSEGCYGNFNCIIYDHQNPHPVHLVSAERAANSKKPMTASLWGPTCDGLDQIKTEFVFPNEVKTGDWIYFDNVGAYTLAASTSFNGFNTHTEVFWL